MPTFCFLLLLCIIFQLVNSINKVTMLLSIEDLRKIIKTKFKISRYILCCFKKVLPYIRISRSKPF